MSDNHHHHHHEMHGEHESRNSQLGNNELDDAIVQYGLSIYYEYTGDKEKAERLLNQAADHESVWPCVACLAVWNDLQMRKE